MFSTKITMGDNDRSFWEELKVYEEETMVLLDTTITDMVKEIKENPLVEEFYRVLEKSIIKEIRPLTFALAKLETYYENTLWDESMKKDIVKYVTIIKKHCKKPNLRRRLPPPMLKHTYQSVYKYGERLAEFDVNQQQRITKAIDSLHKYVVKSRRRR